MFVAYYASAELGCFHALGWQPPANVLDLFTEFGARTNGTDWLEGRSLIAALQYFNVDGIGATEKQGMRELVLRGPPWTEQQRADILDYCASDVHALERLLPRMLPEIDLPVRSSVGAICERRRRWNMPACRSTSIRLRSYAIIGRI